MKQIKFAAPLRVLASLILGYVFIAYSGQAAAWIAQALGVLFVVPSFIYLSVYVIRIVRHVPSNVPFMSLGSFILGIWLISDPMIFVGIFNVLLGVCLIFAGLQQLMNAWVVRVWAKVYRIYYLVPILLILGGLFSITSNDRNLVMLVVGIFMVMYAFNEFLRWLLVDLHKPQAVSPEDDNATGDDDYVEIISEDVDEVDSSPVSDVKSNIKNDDEGS